MERSEYPELFQESDKLAAIAQKSHIRLVRAKIGLLLIIGIITAVTWDQGFILKIIGGILLVTFLVLSIVLTAITNQKRFEETWFRSRAIAEATKAAAWRFMMRVKPYDDSLSEKEAETLFLSQLRKIIHAHQSIISELSGRINEAPQITFRMKDIRREPLIERFNFYLVERIRNQRLWYSEKAKWNKNQVSNWFVVTWLLEVIAIVFVLIALVIPITIISPVAIVLATSTGVLAWLNAKSYEEAAQSYGLVAQELAILQDAGQFVTNSDEFSKIMSETEDIITQEHRVWLGRLI